MSRLRTIEFVPSGLQVLAGALGLLDRAGVEVDATRTRSSTEQRAGLMDGTYDLGLTAIDNLIAWDADGDDLIVVAQVERTTILDLCAAPDVRAIAELRGRTLAVDAVDTGFAILLRHVLARHGVEPGAYELLPAGGIRERMDAVVDGRAAAGLLGPPFNGMALDQGCHVLAHAHEEVPRLPGIGAVMRASAPAEALQAVRAWAGALADAAAWATDAREQEAIRMLEASGFDADGARQVFGIRARTVTPAPDGIALLYEMRRDLGMLPSGAPTAKALVQSIA